MITHQIIAEAVKQTKRSNVRRAKMGCVLFDSKGNILCSGHNRHIHHPKRWTLHAEEDVIAKSTYYVRNTRRKLAILVIRIKKDGSTGLAKPCHQCHTLLEKTPFTVYYSDNNWQIRKLDFARKE